MPNLPRYSLFEASNGVSILCLKGEHHTITLSHSTLSLALWGCCEKFHKWLMMPVNIGVNKYIGANFRRTNELELLWICHYVDECDKYMLE